MITAKTVVPIAPAASPVRAYPMENPSAPSSSTTTSASRNEFRRLAEIWS